MKVSEFMNYEEADLLMDQGYKVKLPEWAGHWYKQDGKILVETRTGEIKDTPYPDYTNRTDWFVTDGRRSWPEIQPASSACCMIRRNEWPDDMFVFFRPDNMVPMDVVAKLSPVPDRVREILVAEKRDIHFTGYYCKWNGYQVRNAWVPGMNDLLAQDWEIVR